eukprot:718511-Pelagomonas_calceolata.AAC.6
MIQSWNHDALQEWPSLKKTCNHHTTSGLVEVMLQLISRVACWCFALYAFRNQPEIGQVNLVMLANALLAGELMSKEEAEQQLLLYSQVLVEDYTDKMRAKLGLRTYNAKLSTELMKLM